MRVLFASLLVCFLSALPLSAQPQTKLRPETWRAFRDYTAEVERSRSPRFTGATPFLTVWGDAEVCKKLLAGEVITRRVSGYETGIPNGYVHHWLSAVLVDGVDLALVREFLRDSEHHVKVYLEVVSSEVVERREEYQKVNQRLVKRKLFTVAADTVGEAFYEAPGPGRLLVRGHTLKVSEVVRVGRPDEWLRPTGEGTGLFWGMNGYWWVEESAEGVRLELETITLTRGIPVGVSWLVGPFLRTVPKQSMGATMGLTRDAILKYREQGRRQGRRP